MTIQYRSTFSRGFLLTMVLGSTLGLRSGVTAHAEPTAGLLFCTGSETTTYDPPLTNTPRETHVTINGVFESCPITPDLRLTGGTFVVHNTSMASCTHVGLLPAHQESYSWSNGATSLVDFATGTVTRLANGSVVATVIGTVSAGFNTGFTVTKVGIKADFTTDCLSPGGLPSITGPVTIQFLP